MAEQVVAEPGFYGLPSRVYDTLMHLQDQGMVASHAARDDGLDGPPMRRRWRITEAGILVVRVLDSDRVKQARQQAEFWLRTALVGSCALETTGLLVAGAMAAQHDLAAAVISMACALIGGLSSSWCQKRLPR